MITADPTEVRRVNRAWATIFALLAVVVVCLLWITATLFNSLRQRFDDDHPRPPAHVEGSLPEST